MGNSLSIGDNSITVHMDKASYCPGDSVSGEVVLELTEEVDCQAINLEVAGLESVWFNSSRQHSQSLGDYHRGQHVFLQETDTLRTFHERLQPGRHEIPFVFVLPTCIPGSFDHGDGGYKAKIEFKVTAKAIVPGLFYANCSDTQTIQVDCRPKKCVRAVKERVGFQVGRSCCTGRSVVHVNIGLDKDAYCPGDTARFIIEVEGGVSFNQIRIQLVRVVTLCSGATADRSYFIEDIERYEECCHLSLHQLKIKPGKHSEQLDFPMWDTLVPETEGSAVSCKYHFIVNVDRGYFSQPLEVTIPISVCRATQDSTDHFLRVALDHDIPLIREGSLDSPTSSVDSDGFCKQRFAPSMPDPYSYYDIDDSTFFVGNPLLAKKL